MELLFDKDGSGTAEIKELLGFIDADIKFSKLKPFIIPATDEIIKLIGQPIYDMVVDIYEALNPNDLDKEFLYRVRFAILWDAYRSFSIQNDLGHTTNGRVNRIEEKQKIAFEWQIDRSNKSMERSYYKAVDAMIFFMDKNIDEWKTSDAFKETHQLLLRDVDVFEDYFNLEGSRLLLIKLSPGIRKAERDQIIARIGKDRYNTLRTKLQNNESDYDTVLLKKIQEALAYCSLAWGIPRMSAQLFPEGLFVTPDTSRLTTAARKSIEKNEAISLAENFQKDSYDALIALETYIKSLNPIQTTVLPLSPNFDCNDNFVNT